MSEIKQNIKARQTWLRGFFILVFAAIWAVAEMLLVLLVLFQFFNALFTGKPNELLLGFGKNLSRYIYQILLYFTFNSDDKPFPFRSWPSVNQGSELPQH